MEEISEPNVFLSWEWASTWWRHFGHGEPHILCLEDGHRLLGVAPLVASTIDGQTVISLIGNYQTTDYADALVHPQYRQDFARLLLQYLRGRFPSGNFQLALEPLPESSLFLEVFQKIAAERGIYAERQPVETCPQIALPPDWDTYLASLGKDERHELRRKMRRALAAGRVEHRVFRRPEDLPSVLPVFYQLHRKSHEAKARFLTRTMEAFFDDLAYQFARRGWLRLAIFELDDVPVAATLSFQRQQTTYLYNSGFDPDFRHLSVGIVLLGLEIQQLLQEGVRRYDFLRGNEPYKYDFGAKDSYVYSLTVSVRPGQSLPDMLAGIQSLQARGPQDG